MLFFLQSISQQRFIGTSGAMSGVIVSEATVQTLVAHPAIRSGSNTVVAQASGECPWLLDTPSASFLGISLAPASAADYLAGSHSERVRVTRYCSRE